MSNAQARTSLLCGVVALGLLLASIPSRSDAQDIDRIGQLEKEIEEIKERLSRLEGSPGSPSNIQRPANAAEGWKVLSNWRQLKTGMSREDVRGLLGEPRRIEGGELESWYYANSASLMFFNGRLNRWMEPR